MRDTRRQLRTVGDMHRHFLPHSIPQLTGWDIEVHHQLGDCPGGNFYDFLPLNDGRCFLVLADASDQGAPATALIAMLRVVLHSCPLSTGIERSPFCPVHGEVVQSPPLILGNVNRVLAENSLEEQHVAAFCGLLSPVEGTLHFANASHLLPRWWHARGGTVDSLPHVAGLPLGMNADAVYHHKRIALETGDMLVFHTNGLSAALNARGTNFSRNQIDDIVRDCARQGVTAVKDGILTCFVDFLDQKPPQDDVTLLILQKRE